LRINLPFVFADGLNITRSILFSSSVFFFLPLERLFFVVFFAGLPTYDFVSPAPSGPYVVEIAA